MRAVLFSLFALSLLGIFTPAWAGIVPIPADLAITKTDGVTTATAGVGVTYTITASNAGPNTATNATVADTFPAALTGTWTCVGASGGTCTASGSGNINDIVQLPSGSSVTFTVSAAISAAATGTISNTATISPNPTYNTDPTPGNNSATDTDTITPLADLSITKTDGVTSVNAGGSTTYTITASNLGPSNVSGATVTDTFPAALAGTWTCAGTGGGTCTAAGSGNINTSVNLPAGGSVIFTVSTTVSAAATGTLSNTATISPPASVAETNPANNSATDTDTIVAASSTNADLSITKTDGVTSAIAGGSVTYTITASNAGPAAAINATVADTFPAGLTGTWTCVGTSGGTCTAAGSGNINDAVNLPAGGSVTYTVSAAVNSADSGTLSNTATVSSASTDPNPANNSATDTDTITQQADLSITNTDGSSTWKAGTDITYTITVSNAGPSATGALVADVLPAHVTGTWTCSGAGGATCSASGIGDISDSANLPVGGTVTYIVTTSIDTSILQDVFNGARTLSNTAAVSASGGVADLNPANNIATDTDTIASSGSAFGGGALNPLLLAMLGLFGLGRTVLRARRQ